MIEWNRMRSMTVTVIATAGTLFLTGCALIQPRRVPQFGVRSSPGAAACAADIARAHAALGTAGAAAGDPAATAAAHAANAAAMADYHACLARESQP